MSENKNHITELQRAFDYSFVKNFVTPSSTVLDLGGDGSLGFALRDYVKRSPSRYVLVSTKWRGPREAPTWFEVALAVPVEEEFSRVVCLDVFSDARLPDQKKILKTMAKALKDDGRAIIATPGPIFAALLSAIEKAGFTIVDSFGTRSDGVVKGRGSDWAVLDRAYDATIAGAFAAAFDLEGATRVLSVLERVDPKARKAAKVEAKATKPARSKPPKASTKGNTTKLAGKPRLGIGAFMRERIIAGDSDDEVLAKTHKKFAGKTTAKMSDVSWNKRKLVNELGYNQTGRGKWVKV